MVVGEVRGGGGVWCGSCCLTPLSLRLEEAHPNLQDKSEEKERMDRDMKDGNTRRGTKRGKGKEHEAH